jgi:hypothetical protein
MRRALLLAVLGSGLLVAFAGVALAADITCPPRRTLRGYRATRLYHRHRRARRYLRPGRL